MKLGVCQMNVVQGAVAENQITAQQMIREAASEGAQLVVLPEMWTSGYDFAHLDQHAEDLDGPSAHLLRNLAMELGVVIVGGSIPIRHRNGVCNTSVAYDSQGQLLGVYRKVHLIGLMNEDKYLLPGEELTGFEFDTAGSSTANPRESAKAATIICYDLRFPELARGAMQGGAQVLFIPAEWPVQRRQHWEVLLTARAIENQMFVVGANMAGRNVQDTFAGGSRVIDPWGDTVAQAGDSPEILYADIDLQMVAEVRKRVPSLRDRRVSVYSRILDT